MTPEEIQEIVAAVIQSLKTNGKTIDQLTAVTTIADTECFELGGGKKITFGKLKELVATTSSSVDIVDNLDSDDATKALSARQGNRLDYKTDASGVVERERPLDKTTSSTRYMRINFVAKKKKYLITLTSSTTISGGIDLYACIGAASEGRSLIATIDGLTANTPKSVIVEFPDNQRTYLWADEFQNVDVVGTISDIVVYSDKINAVKSKVVTKALTQYSSKSTWIIVPEGFYRTDKKYTVTLTFDQNLAAPFNVYTTQGNSSTGQTLFARIEENVTANVPFTFSGSFPADKANTYFRIQELSGVINATGTITTDMLDVEEEDLDEALAAKISSIRGKTVTGAVTLRSADSTFVNLPFKVYKDRTYTLSFTLTSDITGAPYNIYSCTYYGSTGQALFASIPENAEAGTVITLQGTFPDDDRICLRCTDVFPNSGFTGTISSDALDIEMDDLSDEIKLKLDPMGDIVALNDESKNILDDVSLNHANGDNLNVLTIAHISDTHGDDENMERFNEFVGNFSTIIDDKIHTGDVMKRAYNLDDFDQTTYNELFADTMMVVGNHDTAQYENSTFNWTAHQGIDSFNRYLKGGSSNASPLYNGWGVTLPTNAATNGYCYYYKDYTAKKIRLIVLDAMDSQGQTQMDWLQDRLDETLDSTDDAYGFAVIIAYHYIPSSMTMLDVPFTSKFDVEGVASHETLVDIVANFIADGGEFVAWLVGHVHRDYTGKIVRDVSGTLTSQLVLCVATGSTSASNQDCARVVGEKSQDLFNIYGFDTTSKLVKIYRVGCDCDMWLQRKETACINYQTMEVITPENVYMPEIEVSGTSVTQILDPNKFYKFTGAVTSLTVTLGTAISGIVNMYAFSFVAGQASPNITLPNGVDYDEEPTIAQGDYVEFSIKDNKATAKVWTTSS